MNAAHLADLRRQSADTTRAGYDGHGVQSGLVTMRRLSLRRARRRMRRWLGAMVRLWEES